jgi:hypothetical protein
VPTLGRTLIVDTAVSPVVRDEGWTVLRTGETPEVTAALAKFLEPGRDLAGREPDSDVDVAQRLRAAMESAEPRPADG